VAVTKEGKTEEVPLVKQEEIKSWLPPEVREHIYPAGTKKLNPEAVNTVEKQAKANDPDAVPTWRYIQEAEKVGAAQAFRKVAWLPAVLVVIFGLIALLDKLRGGYKAVHIGGDKPKDGAQPALGHSDWAGFGGPDAVRKGPGRVER
jgi:hypothetical protein